MKGLIPRTVWKYPFISHEPLSLQLPVGAIVRHVGVDPAGKGTLPCLWIEVGQRGLDERRSFDFFGTGHDVPETAAYIGTVIVPQGYVWHVYEVDL